MKKKLSDAELLGEATERGVRRAFCSAWHAVKLLGSAIVVGIMLALRRDGS